MRKWQQYFLAGVLVVSTSGCATQYPNPWETLEVDTTPAEQPLPLPELPEPIAFTEDTVTLSKAGAQRILEYKTAAEANTQMASEYAYQADSLKDASASLVEAGRAQRALTDLAQQTLEEERRRYFWEKVVYWVGLLTLASAL